jgi:hypothetical protein
MMRVGKAARVGPALEELDALALERIWIIYPQKKFSGLQQCAGEAVEAHASGA